MPLPATDTLVTYPAGATSGTGTVLHVEPFGNGLVAVVLDRTPFHAVDTAWPDQPADRGALTVAGRVLPIEQAVTGGIRDGALHLGEHLPVRIGTEGWTFVVAHIVAAEGAPAPGNEVRVDVDAEHRAALSAGHTACHLASLALDAAFADAWTKPAPADALGAPAFDALAIQTSRIVPHGSVDTYRIGKSLRRKGFDAAALERLDAVAATANDLLAAWIGTDAPVHIERDAEGLSDRRRWVCALPAGRAEIPCGGTHVTRLGALGAVTVALEARDATGGRELVMTTTAG